MPNDDLSPPFHWEALDYKAINDEYPPAPAAYADARTLSRDEIIDRQQRRFLAVVASAWKIPFYARLWGSAGLVPADITSLEHLQRLPIFTVKELRESVERKPPYGDYVGIERGNRHQSPITLVTSGGTTGMPRPMLYSAYEREVMTILRARALHMHGVRAGDLVQITTALGLSNGGIGTRDSVQRYNGAIAVSTGSGNSTPSRRQIEIARALGTNVILGFPAYLRHLARVARDEIGMDPRALNIKVLSSHLGTEDRKPIEELWGCPCLDSYGCHEVGQVASECEHGTGMHIFEDAVIAEIVDGNTGLNQPDNTPGSLVLTSLYRKDVPFIRYNINDVASVANGTCACGNGFRQLSKIMGRGDLMVKVRGVNVFPEAIGAVISAEARSTGEFFCTVDRVGPDGRDELKVAVELLAGDDESGVCAAIELRLKEVLGIKVAVQAAEPGGLASLTGTTSTSKPKRMQDNR